MPRIQAVRPGSAAMPEPLPAPDNGRAGSADSGRTAGRASQGQPSRRRSRRHRGPQATPGRGERQDKRADSRAGGRNQPQRDRHTREPKGNSKHKKHHRFTRMRRGGRPAQGGTPATVGSCWPGHRQARPPLVGGLPPCAGLALALPAGEPAGIPARRRRSPAPRRARMRGEAALAPPMRAAV